MAKRTRSNHRRVLVATNDGPATLIRFRTKKDMDAVRRAAREQGLSMNTFVITEVVAQARNYLADIGHAR